MHSKGSTHDRIIRFLHAREGKWFLVKEFCKPFPKCFVGYEAGTRLGDLVRSGMVITRKHGDTRFNEYTLDPSFDMDNYERIQSGNTEKE